MSNLEAGEQQSSREAQSPVENGDSSKEQRHAAALIQKNYRGYRERRQLEGMGLDASSPKWRNATKPIPRSERPTRDTLTTPEQRSRAASDAARQNWKRVGEIARRAGGDDPVDEIEDDDDQRTKAQQKAEREKTAKMMDLQYFLEMVDQKHRYGSNLRAYHEQWKKSETNENFFYWLDYGNGKDFELPTVSRERLEKEQVRYLSREERLQYLVKVDNEGRLCWAKNGERISTTMDYKDSINGIVSKDDSTPAYAPGGKLESGPIRRSSTDSSSSESSAEHSDVEGEHYVNHDLKQSKGLAKIKYVSAATVLNHLLRGSVKPNSWIFVADTQFRLYVGIKQSGAFQHSSFLHGARISAAGLIKIKDGQLRRLSPLSGHYRPPTKNFRAFVHSLKDNGVDMSRVSISRSYAVLVGLEMYVKTRRKVKHGIEHAHNSEIKVMHPEEYEKKIEESKDKSKSAQKERQLIAAHNEKHEAEKREKSWRRKIWHKIRHPSVSSREDVKEKKHKDPVSKSGQDVESGIPPSGKRASLGGT
ncbi:uncharacterized protein N0V89_011643 [Didymosphaeria variabile]|uniref:IQ calmodulin-binding motif protein n=1 Tax=Didymosphaeria variabile TaxID=1932322 RepID=A0A9W9C5J8_9PLEO|nr:uncharacterized protein N0V89_011643 [Didymosphaeria variabile]KAJ4345510.1 hypothetical protein N0V89_011643 [Didymosphaeria variabile]